jgi:hypothetical protein
MRKPWWMAMVLVGFAAGVGAQIPDRSLNRADFTAQADDVREGMQTGGEYAFLKPDQREAVEADLGLMAELLAKNETLGQLPEKDLIQIFNAQERVNAVLTQREEKRVVCERRKVLGSNIPKNDCRSYGAWKLAQRQLGENEKMRFQQCRGSGCQRELSQ